jgi:Ni/Co efflux regulator RcnB
MNTKGLIAIAMALNMAAGSVALAQGNFRNDDRGRNDQSRRDNDRRNDRSDNRDDRRNDRYDNRRDNRRDFGRSHNEYRSQGRGAGPGHQYYRGDRFPAEYRSRHYVVNDWRSHRLSAPPSGHQWVQSGNDYVLIAVATGIIAQLLLGN